MWVLLGLFHVMQRVLDTLDHRCDLCWEALVSLQKCFYKCDDTDMKELLEALKEGLLGGQKHTDKQTKEIRHSKKWNARHCSYLRKLILQGPIICQNLTDWVDFFKNKVDNQQRPIFDAKTEAVVEEQKKKVKHAMDPPNVEMHRRIPKKKNSPHNLQKHICLRPESALEREHGKMAHYANVGAKATRADSLTIGGVAQDNVKKRWMCYRDQKIGEGVEFGTPLHFADEPLFWDHSELLHSNERANQVGIKPLFECATPINQLNDKEEFGAKCFFSQQERNDKFGQDPKTKMCLCPDCRNLPWDATAINTTADCRHSLRNQKKFTTSPSIASHDSPSTNCTNPILRSRECIPTTPTCPAWHVSAFDSTSAR